MKKLFFFFLLFSTPLFSQTTFQRTYGGMDIPVYPYNLDDYGFDAEQTSDGGFIIAGSKGSYIGGPNGSCPNFFLIRTNSYGDTLWTTTLRTDSGCVACSVSQTTDGGFIVVGNVWISGWDVDVFIVKTNANGDTMWTKRLGRPVTGDYGRAIKQTMDGGFILTGKSNNAILLCKLNSIGDTLWTRIYDGNPLAIDEGIDVIQTFDSAYIVAGQTWSFGAGWNDAFLLKTNNNGVFQWAKTYGAIHTDVANSVIETPDSCLVFAGGHSYLTGSEIYVVKTNSNGDTLWTRQFIQGGDGWANSIDNCTGGYILAGNVNYNNAVALRLNSVGDTLWTRSFGGNYPDNFWCTKQTSDSGFIFTGSTKNFYVTNTNDVYFVKTNSSGFSGCNEVFFPFVPDTTITYVNSFNPTLSSGMSAFPSHPMVHPFFLNSGNVTTLCLLLAETEIMNDFQYITISPNPSNEIFTINFEQGKYVDGKIEIINILGEVVSTSNIINQSSIQINLSSQPKGIYLVKVISGNNIASKKIVLQ